MLRPRNVMITGALLAFMWSSATLPASATHTHVAQLGNGQCVVLAENGNEKYVQLPNADEFDENRRHPLHVKVHLGEAGARNGEDVIFVKGSPGDIENCDSYANE
ncbi:MAG: hypothetical protein GEU86_18160 [Actinophytocola sp.]|nr:hypothetical protein [Actinophytocola sp.]